MQFHIIFKKSRSYWKNPKYTHCYESVVHIIYWQMQHSRIENYPQGTVINEFLTRKLQWDTTLHYWIMCGVPELRYITSSVVPPQYIIRGALSISRFTPCAAWAATLWCWYLDSDINFWEATPGNQLKAGLKTDICSRCYTWYNKVIECLVFPMHSYYRTFDI